MPAWRYRQACLGLASPSPRRPAGLPFLPRVVALDPNLARGQDAVADRPVLVEPYAAQIRNGDRGLARQSRHPGWTVHLRRSGVMKAPSLAEWLKAHDLERFLEIFEENEVDLATLRLLTENDLKELG